MMLGGLRDIEASGRIHEDQTYNGAKGGQEFFSPFRTPTTRLTTDSISRVRGLPDRNGSR